MMAQGGGNKRLKYRVPLRLGSRADPPFGRVFELGNGGSNKRRWMVAALSLAVYVGVVSLALLAPREEPPSPRPREVPITALMAPPEPPPPQPPPVEPEPEKRPAPSQKATPPAAAQTAKALTRADTAPGPVDLSDFDLVVGQADSYAGGVSAAAGTSPTAVNTLSARPAGRAERTRPSEARPAAPTRGDWSCAWPEDEQQSDRREARVAISVTVTPSGRPQDVVVIGNPSTGFAEAARQCALRESFAPALDAQGHRVQSQTPPFVVHFVR
jgi:TonB family protein